MEGVKAELPGRNPEQQPPVSCLSSAAPSPCRAVARRLLRAASWASLLRIVRYKMLMDFMHRAMWRVRAILYRSFLAVTPFRFKYRSIGAHAAATPSRVMHDDAASKPGNIVISPCAGDQGCRSDSECSSWSGLHSDLMTKNMPFCCCMASPVFLGVDILRRVVPDNWTELLGRALQSAVRAAIVAAKKAKLLSVIVLDEIDEIHLEKVVVPIGGAFFGAIMAWFVIPIVLRKLHKYSNHNPLSVFLGSNRGRELSQHNTIRYEVSYENSLWNALEDPAKYLLTFMAFCQLGVIIAPSIADYIPQAWRGGTVLSFVYFLHRWKTNFFAGALANEAHIGLDRGKLSALEKVCSLGLIVLGVMAFAEACNVGVQSILTVGGVGGVATAFAARDILGNLLSGFSLQFQKPFTVGDYIKAGSIEGQVVEIGLTTTSLINPEKFPVIVPNSLFSSQVIVNKSRAQWRVIATKIPIRNKDLEKIPVISEDIKEMLRSNPKVFLEKDAPYCYLSRLESSFGELTIGCNLKNMRKDELCAAEEDVLIQAARIIKQHGAELGSTLA